MKSFTMVYANPVNGSREHTFGTAQQLASHVLQNRPDIFMHVPDPNRDNFQRELSRQTNIGWCIDWKNKLNQKDS